MVSQFLYRAFHVSYSSGKNCAHGFRAGASESENQLPDSDSVRLHLNGSKRYRTPWISTTENLLRAIKRAQQLTNEYGSADISIAVIEVAACLPCEYYLAADLASAYGLGSRRWWDEEYLFRFSIPNEAVVCCLSLDTLQERGLYEIVPELRTSISADRWKKLIGENWSDTCQRHHLTNAGSKAAKFGFLFGDGVHTAHIGLEAAGWFEEWVASIVKRRFYAVLRQENETPDCFEL